MLTENVDPPLRERLPLYPGQFLCTLPLASLGPLLDSMMHDLGIPLGRAGLINASLFLGTAMGMALFSIAMAGWPAKRIFSGSTGLLGLGLALGGAFAYNLWVLCLAFFVMGLTTGFVFNTCFSWLSAHMKQNLAGSALALIVFFGLGMTIVPVIVGLVLDAGATWRQVMLVEGALVFLCAIAFAFLPLLDIPGRRNVRLAHIKEAGARNPWLLVAILGAGFSYTGAEGVMNFWLPKYQIDIFSSTDSLASLSVTLFWAGLVAGRIGFIPMTRRFKATRLLSVCMSIMAIFSVAMAVAPSQGVALGMALGAGVGASASYGLISSYTRHFPGAQSGVVMSLFILSGAVGSAVLPYILGPIASVADFRVAMALVAVPAMGCVLFSEVIHRRAEVDPRRPE